MISLDLLWHFWSSSRFDHFKKSKNKSELEYKQGFTFQHHCELISPGEFCLRIFFILIIWVLYGLVGYNYWWGWTQREKGDDLSKIEAYGPSSLFFGLWIGKKQPNLIILAFQINC